MLSVAFFISFHELLSSRISAWFFFYDLCFFGKLLTFNLYFFIILLNCLSSLIAHWVCPKQLFLRLARLQKPMLLISVFREWLSFRMTRFLDFSWFLQFYIAFFALERAGTALKYCWLPSDGIFCSLVLFIEICLPLCGYIFPLLLLPMVAEFFSFSVLFLQHHRLTPRPFFCFQKVVLL